MKKRKIWAALEKAGPHVVFFGSVATYVSWIAIGIWGGIMLAEEMRWSKEIGGAVAVGFGLIAGVTPMCIFFGRQWWRDLEPAEPPEILRRRAARHDEKSGAISEAPSVGGELSEVER